MKSFEESTDAVIDVSTSLTIFYAEVESAVLVALF
jgi:hypothetical protein